MKGKIVEMFAVVQMPSETEVAQYLASGLSSKQIQKKCKKTMRYVVRDDKGEEKVFEIPFSE